jgi:hypothetical protein
MKQKQRACVFVSSSSYLKSEAFNIIFHRRACQFMRCVVVIENTYFVYILY